MRSELIPRISYTLARARHLHRPGPAGSPTVVFSMAKTGSSAIASALRTTGIGPVHHVHDLDPAFLEREEAEYRWSGRPWRIWDAQRLSRAPATPAAPWRVVSIVRDPIAQSISAFFQPGSRRGYLNPTATVSSLREGFGDRLDRLPLHWFDTHVLPALGIDVYATPFDQARGYQLISTPTVRLLLLRCEGLTVAPTALAELLELRHPVEVPHVNVGAEKDYAELYEAFRLAIRPDAEQLDRAYGSRLVRHFYSAGEINRFRALWSGGASSSRPASIDGDIAR